METRTITITVRTDAPPQSLVDIVQLALRDKHIIPSTIEVK